MAKDEPKPPASEAPAPSAPVTMNDLLALVRELVAGNRLDTAAIADIVQGAAKASADAAADVFEKTSGQWWDLRKFPQVSAFNKAGEKDHPKDDLRGEIFWVGYRLHKDELTPTEIGLLNRLQPGAYHAGEWIVRDLLPDVPNTRKLLVLFPCKDEASRLALPPSMTRMLREMVEGIPALEEVA